MCKDLLRQPAPLCLVKGLVKAQQSPAALQTVAGHLQLVHGVNVLDVQLYARPVRSFGCPHIQVFMSTRLKVQRVVAVIQVCELGQERKLIFGVQF